MYDKLAELEALQSDTSGTMTRLATELRVWKDKLQQAEMVAELRRRRHDQIESDLFTFVIAQRELQAKIAKEQARLKKLTRCWLPIKPERPS
jgi:hypothetical protein